MDRALPVRAQPAVCPRPIFKLLFLAGIVCGVDVRRYPRPGGVDLEGSIGTVAGGATWQGNAKPKEHVAHAVSGDCQDLADAAARPERGDPLAKTAAIDWRR
jgi:hypothetical protein